MPQCGDVDRVERRSRDRRGAPELLIFGGGGLDSGEESPQPGGEFEVAVLGEKERRMRGLSRRSRGRLSWP